MAVEREIKLTADVDLVLPDLASVVDGLAVGPVSKLHLDAIYYDTPTLAMARWGVTLRSRTGEPGPHWTLKVDSGEAGPGLSRHEYLFDEPLGPVPIAASQAVRALIRDQSLGPVVRLHTERAERTLELDGHPLIKLCDDIVTAEGSEHVNPFREIELELMSEHGGAKVAKAVRAVLCAAGCHDWNPLPKAIRALGARALEPPDVERISVGKRATTNEFVRHVIGKSVAQLIDRHAGVWLGEDPEELHVFRVSARRLRSDLRTFSALLDQHWTSEFRDELAWLGAEVGLGRDADVLAERLRSQMEQLPGEDAASIERLLQRLTENSSEARRHVVAALAADRYVALLDSLVGTRRERHGSSPTHPGLLTNRQATDRRRARAQAMAAAATHGELAHAGIARLGLPCCSHPCQACSLRG